MPAPFDWNGTIPRHVLRLYTAVYKSEWKELFASIGARSQANGMR